MEQERKPENNGWPPPPPFFPWSPLFIRRGASLPWVGLEEREDFLFVCFCFYVKGQQLEKVKRPRISVEGLWAPNAKVFSDFFAFSLPGSGIPEYKVPDGTNDQNIIQNPGKPRGEWLFSEAIPGDRLGGRVSFSSFSMSLDQLWGRTKQGPCSAEPGGYLCHSKPWTEWRLSVIQHHS